MKSLIVAVLFLSTLFAVNYVSSVEAGNASRFTNPEHARQITERGVILRNDAFTMIEGQTRDFNFFANDDDLPSGLYWVAYNRIPNINNDVSALGVVRFVSPPVGVYTTTYKVEWPHDFQEAQIVLHVIPRLRIFLPLTTNL